MKSTTLIALLATASSYAYAEDLFTLLESQEEAEFDAAEALALEEEDAEPVPVRIPCHERISSVDEIDIRCYFKSPFYQGQDRDTKLNQLWSKLVPEGAESTAPIDYKWVEFPKFFEQRANGSFCQSSDAITGRRRKTTHTQGLVAKVAWEPVDNNGYSGVFETGSDHVIMRLSETMNLNQHSKGLTPSAAFKFLFDGIQSQNILVMNSMLESSSWNWFEEPLANRVRKFNPETHPIEVETKQKKMLESNGRPFGLAFSQIANKNLDGSEILREEVKIPYEIQFHSPNKDAFAFTDNNEMWYDRLKNGLATGDTIYEVWALTAPEELGGTLEHVANVKMLTDLNFSEWGDDKLYFRHRPQHQDFKYYPDRAWRRIENEANLFVRDETTVWNQEVPDTWPQETEAAKDMYEDQVLNHGCPFQWLLEGITA